MQKKVVSITSGTKWKNATEAQRKKLLLDVLAAGDVEKTAPDAVEKQICQKIESNDYAKLASMTRAEQAKA